MKHLTESEVTAVCIHVTGFAAEESGYQLPNHKLRRYETVDWLGQVMVSLVEYYRLPALASSVPVSTHYCTSSRILLCSPQYC